VVGKARGKSRPVEFSQGSSGEGDGGGFVTCYEPLAGVASCFSGRVSIAFKGERAHGGGAASCKQPFDDSYLLHNGVSSGGGFVG